MALYSCIEWLYTPQLPLYLQGVERYRHPQAGLVFKAGAQREAQGHQSPQQW